MSSPGTSLPEALCSNSPCGGIVCRARLQRSSAACSLQGASAFGSLGQVGEFRCEYQVRHGLAAADQTRLVGTVIRFGVVQRPEIVPDHEVPFAPVMCVLKARLQLVLDQ